ncbi:MAG TPA: hypothetical protein VG817_01360, partial [Gemmatimonadales bacterium]|nr:hypothetical protein [Gemmatimonadales bacterium]
AEKLGDIDLADVGKDAKLPWELDGPKWHTRDRITTKGTPIKWDGDALTGVVEQIEALGEWGETNWNHRTIVEIAPPKKSQGWFLHAMTGHEAYLKLCFRVRRNAFKTADLAASLSLRPLSDYPGHEGYSRDHRVEVTNDGRGPGQTVVVTIVKKEETETATFRAFLKKCVESFGELIGTFGAVTAKVEAAMPWKVDGEKWHLGDKGFPPGKGRKWDRGLLPKLLKLLRDIEPKVKIQWDVVDAITVRVPQSNRFWVRIKTKEAAALEVWLPAKPSQFNLARWEGAGRDATLERGRWEGLDVVTLKFVTADDFKADRLKPLLAEQLRGFLEVFAA